uniref:MCF.2 cell line derived transforming sequence like n=1 Tax=Sphenodon punctatus TaxID=8508 RepID=A0A8D0GV99_SPHPU
MSGAEDLQEALTSILGILKAVNDSMHQIAITGYDVSDSVLFILKKIRDTKRTRKWVQIIMQKHFFTTVSFLLQAELCCLDSKVIKILNGISKKNYLICCVCQMTAVGITETVKGDAKKFEIWYNAREEVYIIQAPTPEIKATWLNEIRKVWGFFSLAEASQHRALEQTHSFPTPASSNTSPSRNMARNIKKLEERKTDPLSPEGHITSAAPKCPEKSKDDTVISPTSECSALSKKRFTLQGFTNLKSQKASPTSPDKKAKRHEVKSDPTPFGFRGWAKTSQSLDVSEENDCWSSAEDPLNSSDAEEEGGGEKKLTPGKYTVVADYDKRGSEEFTVKNGDLVQLIREGEDELWYVKNLSTSKEGCIPLSSLLMLIGNAKSAQSLSSSESGTGTSTLSSSSSCSESCNASSISFSDIKG